MKRIYLTGAEEVIALRNAGVEIWYRKFDGSKEPWLYSNHSERRTFHKGDGRHIAESFVKDRVLFIEVDDEQGDNHSE